MLLISSYETGAFLVIRNTPVVTVLPKFKLATSNSKFPKVANSEKEEGSEIVLDLSPVSGQEPLALEYFLRILT